MWVPKDAWNFRYFNKTVWTIGGGIELNFNSLLEGQILGIKIPFSSYNERRDKRHNPVLYSHMATVLCHFYDGEAIVPWIFHNIYGVGDPESLPKFLRRTGSVVMEVFNPREDSILRKA